MKKVEQRIYDNENIPTVKLLWGMDSHNKETMINAQMIYSGLWDYEKEME